MDRETRKANLKKLQLPGTGGKQRKTRQSTKTSGTSSISNYFPTPEKSTKHVHDNLQTLEKSLQTNIDNNNESAPSKPKAAHGKRTKLDAFIFKEPQTVTKELNTEQKCLNDEDFDVPEKKAKKSPQISDIEKSKAKTRTVKPSRRKKQTTIKSAFLRNEQLFAEIAAQHCAVDNFDGDDVQLAIAISKSEAETIGIAINDENPVNNVDNIKDGEKDAEVIRQQLEKYGFRTAEKKDYNTFAAAFVPKPNGRRKKSKWANKFTALTLRDEQVQNKKFQQKIEDLLNQQFRTRALNAEEQQHSNYQLQSILLRKIDKKNNKKILRKPEEEQKPYEQYFVQELFDISKLPPGHLLKDWKAIQGRDLTPNKLGPHKDAMAIKLRTIYAELEEYFQYLKSSNRKNDSVLDAESKSTEVNVNNKTYEDFDSIVNENPITLCNQNVLKSEEHITPTRTDDICKNYFNPFQDIDPPDPSDTSSTSSTGRRLIQLMPPTKSLDLIQVSNTSIRTEAATFNSSQIYSSNTSHDPETTTITSDTSPTKALCNRVTQSSMYLDVMQISSTSIGTEATINSTQKTRSNSPDLFADSDVEMEEKENIEEDGEAPNDLDVSKSNTSMDNVAGVTTYEIYSSDEVKNTLLSEIPDRLPLLKEKLSLQQNMDKENVIDLTQDDEGENRLHDTLNCSKPIVEVDLFADSPLHDEESELIADINSNSQKSKYMKSNVEKTLELSLRLEANGDATYAQNKNKEDSDSFKCTISMETDCTDEYKNEEDVDFAKKNKRSSLLNYQGTTVVSGTNKYGEDSLQLSLSLEDDDSVVLREMAVNQTNTSFLNFQGTKQLETYFHRETASEPRVEHKQAFAGNNTIFRELYNKYLGSGAATQEFHSSKANDSRALRKSFSQNLPKVVTPKRDEQEIQFGIDMETTLECYMTKRKSLSFNAKTPDKTTFSIIAGLSKSQSFTEQNISIDLTQNDEDDAGLAAAEEEEDDDCVVLSDDEINYSIWKANKTENYGNSDCEDAVSVEEFGFNEKRVDEKHEQKNVSKCKQKSDKESSLLDILNEELSPHKIVVPSQSSYSDFELPSPNRQDWDHKLERSNFGIMEEFSEPIDFTPNLTTPTKVLAEASFLQSPPEELSAPKKRYSNGNKSTQKFNDLLKSIDNEIAKYNNTDEYDAFDYLLYQNQMKNATKSAAVALPKDFEQLMTAEISFKESQEKSLGSNSLTSNLEKVQASSETFRKHLTSPIKTEPYQTPDKSRTDKQELTINNKTYIIRSTDSDKPNYTQYSESELLKELYNYGIKPLKRKQAVKILEYIYNQTHPIIVDEPTPEDMDITDDFNIPSTSNSSKNSKHSYTKSSQNVPSKTVPKSPQNKYAKPTSAPPKEVVSFSVSNKLDLRDGCGMDMLRYSHDLKAELVDEQYILQTNVTKKTPQPLMPFHIAWYNLVCSNCKLHENILMYEPIDLQEIFLFLKGLGYRYDPKELKQFFDHRCIIFRYDIAAGSNGNKEKESNRHVRKKKRNIKAVQPFSLNAP